METNPVAENRNQPLALVTGGGGFLGSYIVDALLQGGWRVRIFQRSSAPAMEQRGVEVHCGSLANADAVNRAVAGCEAVFHVAAKAGVWGRYQDYFTANVTGTRNIIASCKAHKVARLVYTSTPSVVFNGQAFRGQDESLPYGSKFLCAYAETKAQAEREALAANNPASLRVVALRPHLIWGVGDPHLVPGVLRAAQRGRLPIVGDGTNRVDITHVRNAARAHLLALEALENGTAAGKAYFLSQGEPVCLWDWISEILQHAGVPPLRKHVSLRKAYAAGALCELIWKVRGKMDEPPPMTRFVAVELAKDHWFDISAARNDLGYRPEEFTTADGMRELFSRERQAP